MLLEAATRLYLGVLARGMERVELIVDLLENHVQSNFGLKMI